MRFGHVGTDETSGEVELTLSPEGIARVLIFVVLSLTLASVVAQVVAYQVDDYWASVAVRYFKLDMEANVPTWYASSLLLFCSALLGAIGFAKLKVGAPYFLHWTSLSFIFMLLSLDEATDVHLKAGMKFYELVFGTDAQTGFVWVIPGAILVVPFAWAYSKFLAHLPDKTRRLFLIAGGVFVLGALGMEIVGWLFSSLYGQANGYAVIPIAEEFLEMAGIVVFIYALTSYSSQGIGHVAGARLVERRATTGPERV